MMMLKDVSPSDCLAQPPDGHLAFTACRDRGKALPITHAASLSVVSATRECLPAKGTKERLVQRSTQQDVGIPGEEKNSHEQFICKGCADRVVGHCTWQQKPQNWLRVPLLAPHFLCPLSAVTGIQGRLLHGGSLKVIIFNFPSKPELQLLRPFHEELSLLLRLSLLEVFSFCERNRA